MPMTVPLSPSGTVKLSLMLTTLSNSRYSASGSGTTPCCCSSGYAQQTRERVEDVLEISDRVMSQPVISNLNKQILMTDYGGKANVLTLKSR